MNTRHRTQSGFALVATLAVVIAVMLLVFGAAFTTNLTRASTRNDTTTTQAEYLAAAGMQKYKAAAFQTFRLYLDNLDTYATATARYAKCGNLLAIGLDLDRNGALDSTTDLMDGNRITEQLMLGSTNGEYDVWYHVSGETLLLKTVGRAAGAQATLNTVLQAQNGGVFSSALSVGGGMATKFINGAAQVWGSVYVEGNDPNKDVINANGDFHQHNYYTTEDLAYWTGLNASETTSNSVHNFLNLEVTKQENMCARMRVHQGKVNLSGSSTLGDSTAPSGYEAKLQGVNISTGAENLQVTGSGAVYAQAVGAYDLSSPVKVPQLDAYICDTPNYTWRQCMQQEAANTGMVISRGSNGALTISPDVVCVDEKGVALAGGLASLVSTDGTLTFGTKSAVCTTTTTPTRGFSYVYDSAKLQGTLTINGILDLRGMNVYMQEDMVVRYTGKASLMVESNGTTGGNVIVDGDLLPGGKFPDQAVLGLMAEKTLRFTGDNQNGLETAQQVAVGLFYAGEQASVEKGAAVMGNITTPSFCTTSNCIAGQTAKIFQVPGLEYNLPPGFDVLSNSTLPTFTVLSYERR